MFCDSLSVCVCVSVSLCVCNASLFLHCDVSNKGHLGVTSVFCWQLVFSSDVFCASLCVCVYLCVYLCVYVCVPTRENILWEAFVRMERTLRIFLMCWSETCQISDGIVGVRTEGSAEEIGEPWQRVTAENKAFL